jgi:hypothetical protein
MASAHPVSARAPLVGSRGPSTGRVGRERVRERRRSFREAHHRLRTGPDAPFAPIIGMPPPLDRWLALSMSFPGRACTQPMIIRRMARPGRGLRGRTRMIRGLGWLLLWVEPLPTDTRDHHSLIARFRVCMVAARAVDAPAVGKSGRDHPAPGDTDQRHDQDLPL